MIIAKRLEDYINDKETSLSRTPSKYIHWFEEKLKITKEYRELLKTQNLLHKGIAKYFYEELFPLYRLLQNKLEEWGDVEVKPVRWDSDGIKNMMSKFQFAEKLSPAILRLRSQI